MICYRLEIYKTFTAYEQIMEYVWVEHAMCKICPHVYSVGVYFYSEKDNLGFPRWSKTKNGTTWEITKDPLSKTRDWKCRDALQNSGSLLKDQRYHDKPRCYLI